MSAAAVAVGAIGFGTAPAASAHDHPTPLANVGQAVKYNTDHLQYDHLDQPLLGFGETDADPYGWTTGHLFKVVLDTAALGVTGHDAAAETAPEATTTDLRHPWNVGPGASSPGSPPGRTQHPGHRARLEVVAGENARVWWSSPPIRPGVPARI